ncbi:MAG: acetate--CoA ligase family protein [Bacillota bacterium]
MCKLSSSKKALDIASIKPLFNPRSVAVIGASSNRQKPSGQPVIALIENGYTGKVYPVNPNYAEIAGLKCYPDLESIPEPVEVAIIAVGAALTLESLRSCVAKGVKGAIIITSGFSEMGEEGAVMQREITRIAKESGIRVVGPNCMGVFSNVNNSMAGFGLTEMSKGMRFPDFLGFIAQSGGFGSTIYQLAGFNGIGFTHYVSSGNEADVEFSEYMAYMTQDNVTKVIGGYIEGAKNGRKLAEAADMALQAGKPVAIIKTGRYPAGARAAASHTGSMVGSDQVYSAFFKQKGIVRLESVEEMILFISILTEGMLPQGKGVAVLSASGGAGVLLGDTCEGAGLNVTPLTAESQEKLNQLLPTFASSVNPVDLTAANMTQPELFQNCARIIFDDPNIDMVIILYFAHRENMETLMNQLEVVYSMATKPMVATIWGSPTDSEIFIQEMTTRGIPATRNVNFAVGAMAALAEYAERLRIYQAQVPEPPLVSAEGREKVAEVLASFPAGQKLTEYQSKKILAAYGIPATREDLATTAEEAVRIADTLGYPVVAKIESPDILHKTDAGGVKLNLDNAEKVRAAYGEIIANARIYKADADIRGVLIQEMLSGGTEVIVGMATDQVFGPTVLFGLGGIFVEVLEDVSIKVAPLNRTDAREMLEEIKGRKVLDGVRGKPAVDKHAIVDIILKISQLVTDFPQIAEMEINPLLVFADGQGAKAADALLVLK